MKRKVKVLSAYEFMREFSIKKSHFSEHVNHSWKIKYIIPFNFILTFTKVFLGVKS